MTTTQNNKWNSQRPSHYDSMKRVPLKDSIYYCEYYKYTKIEQHIPKYRVMILS